VEWIQNIKSESACWAFDGGRDQWSAQKLDAMVNPRNLSVATTKLDIDLVDTAGIHHDKVLLERTRKGAGSAMVAKVDHEAQRLERNRFEERACPPLSVVVNKRYFSG
jgi:hypothetical protein